MDFNYVGKGDLNYKIYWISDQEKLLTIQQDTSAKIHWAFVKLKYHPTVEEKEPHNLYYLTLANKTNQLKIQSYEFNNSITIDTAYFKKKWVQPFIDTAKLKSKRTKPRPGLYL